MKKFYFKLLFFLIFVQSFNVCGQYVTIPDSNFVNCLINNGLGPCLNGNQLDTTCNLVVSKDNLFCPGQGIHDITGIQYFDSLEMLYCSDNQLTFLPPLPATLTDLDCYDNQLTSLPDLPPLLYWLSCEHNNLTSIPPVPAGMFALKCSYNQLTSLPPLAGATNLFYLICEYNQITSLPSLPPDLGWLHANHNLLSSLPIIPGDPWVQVTSNQISSIAGWPTAGNYQFECDSNLLTTLPPFPYLANFGYMSFRANQITYIPPLPLYVSTLYLDDNPIACPPKISNLYFLSWNNTQISCLPNACFIDSASPPITGLPICDPLSGCDFYYNTYGKVYLDYNSNCQFNANDVRLPNFPVRLDSAGTFAQSMQTMPNGYYSFETNFGNYTTSIVNNYFTNVCPSSGVNSFSISAFDSIAENEDFAVHCPANYDLAAHSINFNEMVWPGQIIPLVINAGEVSTFYNVSCFNNGGDVEVILNGPAYYDAPAPGATTPSNVSGDTIRWTIADFSTVNPYTSFNILVGIDTNAFFGTDICVSLNVSPTSDNDPSNNSLTNCFEIFNSNDPNAKSVFPTGNFDTLTTKWLYYTVYFQNTGNAPASDVYIIDTLDQYLNAGTFSMLSHSHDVITQILPGHIIKFSFPDINLPDSNSNEPLSHGFVSYKIKYTGNIVPGTFIHNTAYIYFDQNAPVITNTIISQNTITGIKELNDNSVLIFPNPSGQFIDINVDDAIKNYQINLFDNMGKLLFNKQSDENKVRVDLTKMNSGFYIIKIESLKGSIVKKLIKL